MGDIAKLFMNGRSQAVRLPAEFRFEGTEVYIRRDPITGDIILSNKNPDDRKKNWGDFFARLDKNRAEAPEEFEDFLIDRDKTPPKDRHLFDDIDE